MGTRAASLVEEVTGLADEEHIDYAVEALGEDIWLFSTDYPHGGTCWPEGVPLITERPIAESAKLKMLGGNAERFMRPFKA